AAVVECVRPGAALELVEPDPADQTVVAALPLEKVAGRARGQRVRALVARDVDVGERQRPGELGAAARAVVVWGPAGDAAGGGEVGAVAPGRVPVVPAGLRRVKVDPGGLGWQVSDANRVEVDARAPEGLEAVEAGAEVDVELDLRGAAALGGPARPG